VGPWSLPAIANRHEDTEPPLAFRPGVSDEP
jgi:hypothetical protein